MSLPGYGDSIQMARPSAPIRRKRSATSIAIKTFVFLVLIQPFVWAPIVYMNHQTAERIAAAANSNASPSFKSRYDDLGALVAQSWLEGGQPVVDTVAGLTWPTTDKGTGITIVGVGYLGGTTTPLEGTSDLHESLRYVAVADDGAQYTVTIDMGILREGDTVRPVLFSAPFVEPRTSVSVVSGTGVPGWATFTAGPQSAVHARALDWARAWTSNDSAALKAITGDTSTARYEGLVSAEPWRVVDSSLNIVWAVQRPSDGLVVVRVVWDIEVPASKGPGTGSALTSEDSTDEVSTPGKTIRQSADLLVADATTGLPRIVAWGAPGTNLVQFQNAIAGESGKP